eukprot:gene20215-26963_t
MRLLLAVPLIAIFLATCQAKIMQSNVDIDDRGLIPLTDSFGYANGGRIIITIKDISIFVKKNVHDPANERKYNLDNFGFFLSPVEADANLELDLAENRCLLNSIHSLFTFKDSAVQSVIKNEADHVTFNLTVDTGGAYFLYFANCETDTPVSFACHIEMFNIDAQGHRDYLSVGDTELSTVFWIMFALFASATAFWFWYVWTNKAHANKIHYLMGALGAFKALTMISQAMMYHYIERTGYADGWNVAYYIFTFFRGILFFVVVVLVGTGWSYMKPFLGDREKRILLVVIPLQEESPSEKDWFTWRDVFHLVDIICCCAILFPIVWSIKHLREASQTDGKAARNLEKLTLFRQFYVMVVVYIYFTRIVVYLLKSTVDYEYAWVSDAADQLAALAFYVWTATKFSPTAENPYLKLNQGEA